MSNLTAEDKLVKARIELLKERPFFGFLCNHLKLTNAEETVPTLGVDIKGNLYYNPKYVSTLSNSALKLSIRISNASALSCVNHTVFSSVPSTLHI